MTQQQLEETATHDEPIQYAGSDLFAHRPFFCS